MTAKSLVLPQPSDLAIEFFKKFLYLRQHEEAANKISCLHWPSRPAQNCECCQLRYELRDYRSMVEVDAENLITRREGKVDWRDPTVVVLSETWWERHGIPFKDDGNYDFLVYGLMRPDKSEWMPGEALPENHVVDFCGKQYRTIYALSAESNIFFPPSACGWERHDPSTPMHGYQRAGMVVMERLGAAAAQLRQKPVGAGVKQLGVGIPEVL